MDSVRVRSRAAQQQQVRRPARFLAFAGAAAAATYLVASPCFSNVQAPRLTIGGNRAGLRTAKVVAYGRGGARGGEARSEAKSALLDLLDDPDLQKEVMRKEGNPKRGRVDESILQLERVTPTEEPAYSELLDGSWTVKYSGSYAPGLMSSPMREIALFSYGGGFSLGTALSSFVGGFWGQALGVNMGAKTVQIKDGRDVEATAEISLSGPLAGQTQTIRYKAELMPLSARRLSEEVTFAELPPPLGMQSAPLRFGAEFW